MKIENLSGKNYFQIAARTKKKNELIITDEKLFDNFQIK